MFDHRNAQLSWDEPPSPRLHDEENKEEHTILPPAYEDYWLDEHALLYISLVPSESKDLHYHDPEMYETFKHLIEEDDLTKAVPLAFSEWMKGDWRYFDFCHVWLSNVNLRFEPGQLVLALPELPSDKNDPMYQYQKGIMLKYGLGGYQQSDLHAEWCFERAAKGGVFEATYYFRDKKFIPLLEKANAVGHKVAATRLAEIYSWGERIENGNTAKRYCSNNDDPAAILLLARMHSEYFSYEKRDLSPDEIKVRNEQFEKAVKLYENAAACGNAIAMQQLGLMYLKGQGVQTDILKGWELCLKAGRIGKDRNRNMNIFIGEHDFLHNLRMNVSFIVNDIYENANDPKVQALLSRVHNPQTRADHELSNALFKRGMDRFRVRPNAKLMELMQSRRGIDEVKKEENPDSMAQFRELIQNLDVMETDKDPFLREKAEEIVIQLQKAEERGDVNATIALAMLWREKNSDIALAIAKWAAESNNAEALFLYAHMLEYRYDYYSKLTHRSQEDLLILEAREYYQRAAELGHVRATFALAKSALTAPKRDVKLACKMLLRAAKFGEQDAVKLLAMNGSSQDIANLLIEEGAISVVEDDHLPKAIIRHKKGIRTFIEIHKDDARVISFVKRINDPQNQIDEIIYNALATHRYRKTSDEKTETIKMLNKLQKEYESKMLETATAEVVDEEKTFDPEQKEMMQAGVPEDVFENMAVPEEAEPDFVLKDVSPLDQIELEPVNEDEKYLQELQNIFEPVDKQLAQLVVKKSFLAQKDKDQPKREVVVQKQAAEGAKRILNI